MAQLLFNLPNIIYWLALGLLILAETRFTPDHFSEEQRWWEGFFSLFGSSAIMVALAGWDAWVWLILALASIAARLLKSHRLVARLMWERVPRENHRWTAQYFSGFMVSLLPIIWADLDIVTWGAMFFSLGVCGAVKVGAHALYDSIEADRLRRQRRARIETQLAEKLRREEDVLNGTHPRQQ